MGNIFRFPLKAAILKSLCNFVFILCVNKMKAAPGFNDEDRNMNLQINLLKMYTKLHIFNEMMPNLHN